MVLDRCPSTEESPQGVKFLVISLKEWMVFMFETCFRSHPHENFTYLVLFIQGFIRYHNLLCDCFEFHVVVAKFLASKSSCLGMSTSWSLDLAADSNLFLAMAASAVTQGILMICC